MRRAATMNAAGSAQAIANVALIPTSEIRTPPRTGPSF
jgi:hypothetical protein